MWRLRALPFFPFPGKGRLLSPAKDNRMDFSGKVALITGSSRGLGKALALEFAKAGASVIVAARSETTGKLPGTIGETVTEIEALGGKAAAVRANVAREEDLVHLAEASLEAFGRVDMLVNNAGISMPYNQLAWEIPAKGWDLLTAINIRAPFRLSSLLLPQMIERGGGSILNISSMAAANNYSGVKDSDGSVNRISVAYGMSKAALERFSTGLGRPRQGIQHRGERVESRCAHLVGGLRRPPQPGRHLPLALTLQVLHQGGSLPRRSRRHRHYRGRVPRPHPLPRARLGLRRRATTASSACAWAR